MSRSDHKSDKNEVAGPVAIEWATAIVVLGVLITPVWAAALIWYVVRMVMVKLA